MQPWTNLNNIEVGRYGESLVKDAFREHGFKVYSADVEDGGVDFVVRQGHGPFLTVQVRTVRGLNYIFYRKDKLDLRPDSFAATVILREEDSPLLCLIPSGRWRAADGVFVSHDYEGKASDPEWGLNVSQKNLDAIGEFVFSRQLKFLKSG